MKEIAQKTEQRQELKIWSVCLFLLPEKMFLQDLRLTKDELSEIRNIKSKFQDFSGRHVLYCQKLKSSPIKLESLLLFLYQFVWMVV